MIRRHVGAESGVCWGGRMGEQVTTPVHVVQPDQGESFWQPVPANGYSEVRVSHRKDPAIRSFATGMQVIAPGSYIREHVHPAQEELLFFFEGEGEAVIDGESHPLQVGTRSMSARGIGTSSSTASAEQELKMCWVMMPGGDAGLDDSSPASAGRAGRASRRPSRSRVRPTSSRSRPRRYSARSTRPRAPSAPATRSHHRRRRRRAMAPRRCATRSLRGGRFAPKQQPRPRARPGPLAARDPRSAAAGPGKPCGRLPDTTVGRAPPQALGAPRRSVVGRGNSRRGAKRHGTSRGLDARDRARSDRWRGVKRPLNAWPRSRFSSGWSMRPWDSVHGQAPEGESQGHMDLSNSGQVVWAGLTKG